MELSLKILISKTNFIGDLSFVLPLTQIIKQHYPNAQVYFLARQLNQPLVDCYKDVDGFIDWTHLQSLPFKQQVLALKRQCFDYILHIHPNQLVAKLAYKAKIKKRIGTINRLYHWRYCNHLLNLSRKNNNFHEAQMDFYFLKALKIPYRYSLKEIASLYHYKKIPLAAKAAKLLVKDKFNLIMHPTARGTYIRWPLKNFSELAHTLPKDKFNIITTESYADLPLVENELLSKIAHLPNVTPSYGELNLSELISLIHHADGLVANSTGPLHLAASKGIHALGLYAPIKPFDAQRWGPIGNKAQVITEKKNCAACREIKKCACIEAISPQRVANLVLQWLES